MFSTRETDREQPKFRFCGQAGRFAPGVTEMARTARVPPFRCTFAFDAPACAKRRLRASADRFRCAPIPRSSGGNASGDRAGRPSRHRSRRPVRATPPQAAGRGAPRPKPSAFPCRRETPHAGPILLQAHLSPAGTAKKKNGHRASPVADTVSNRGQRGTGWRPPAS